MIVANTAVQPQSVMTHEAFLGLITQVRNTCRTICEEMPPDNLHESMKALEELRKDVNVRIVFNQFNR